MIKNFNLFESNSWSDLGTMYQDKVKQDIKDIFIDFIDKQFKVNIFFYTRKIEVFINFCPSYYRNKSNREFTNDLNNLEECSLITLDYLSLLTDSKVKIIPDTTGTGGDHGYVRYFYSEDRSKQGQIRKIDENFILEDKSWYTDNVIDYDKVESNIKDIFIESIDLGDSVRVTFNHRSSNATYSIKVQIIHSKVESNILLECQNMCLEYLQSLTDKRVILDDYTIRSNVYYIFTETKYKYL